MVSRFEGNPRPFERDEYFDLIADAGVDAATATSLAGRAFD